VIDIFAPEVEPTENDLDYEAGYEDGVNGRPKSGDSKDYLEGYFDGVREAADEDYYEEFYGYDDEEDEDW
jgi:hypothetical protein